MLKPHWSGRVQSLVRSHEHMICTLIPGGRREDFLGNRGGFIVHPVLSDSTT